MAQVTDPSAFEHRSLGKQVLFTFLTLGGYSLYWIFKTNEQLAEGTDADFDPALRTLGIIFVPFLNLYWLFKMCKDAEVVTDQSGGMLFVLYILVITSPLTWYFIQSGINETAQSA